MSDREKLEAFEKEQLDIDVPETEVKSKPKKESSNIIETSFLETPDYILEQINIANDANDANQLPEGKLMKFVCYEKKTGTITQKSDFQHNGKVYVPIVDEVSEKNGVALPTGVEEYSSTAEIIKDISEYLSENSEMPPMFEKLFPHLVLFYWLYEQFPFIPYVHFVGRTATGKTTAMEVFGNICYKPIDTTGSLTIASIFRLATAWRGTLLIDEFDNVGENAKEITSFLKSGVSNKILYRTEGEGIKKVRAYIVKSPKIFTSENPINDAGLQSRTIVVKMEKNKRRIPLYRLNHYYKSANKIRNKLLLWRLRNFNKIDLSKIEYGFPELEIFDRRVQQIITPVYYFSDEITRKDILEFAQEQEIETKKERRENLDGKLFEIILDLYQSMGELSLVAITELVNKNNKYPVAERKVAGIIRKVLGFEIEKVGHDNVRTVILDKMEDRLKQLSEYYGLYSPSGNSYAQFASVADEPIENEQVELAQGIFKS
jgi:hypothetical protein